MAAMDIATFDRIDVHAHAITPKYREYLMKTGHKNPDGWPVIPEWTPEQHIAMMDETNITAAILSISTPGTCLRPFDAPLTREITRTLNTELSEICSAYPRRFRFFASLPLPSVSDSLSEVDYALDVLGAVGFCLLSNAEGVYLGDKALDPVLDKLNERGAIVLMHPTSCKVVSQQPLRDAVSGADVRPTLLTVNPTPIPAGLLEYMFDETRAVANLLVSGTVARCPRITFIMSHAGCLLPPVLERIAVALQQFFGGAMNSAEMRRLLNERFYFDLAGLPWPDQVHGLLRVVGPERLMYGSDYCWTPVPLVKSLIETMNTGAVEIWDKNTIKKVYTGTAHALFKL